MDIERSTTASIVPEIDSEGRETYRGLNPWERGRFNRFNRFAWPYLFGAPFDGIATVDQAGHQALRRLFSHPRLQAEQGQSKTWLAPLMKRYQALHVQSNQVEEKARQYYQKHSDLADPTKVGIEPFFKTRDRLGISAHDARLKALGLLIKRQMYEAWPPQRIAELLALATPPLPTEDFYQEAVEWFVHWGDVPLMVVEKAWPSAHFTTLGTNGKWLLCIQLYKSTSTDDFRRLFHRPIQGLSDAERWRAMVKRYPRSFVFPTKPAVLSRGSGEARQGYIALPQRFTKDAVLETLSAAKVLKRWLPGGIAPRLRPSYKETLQILDEKNKSLGKRMPKTYKDVVKQLGLISRRHPDDECLSYDAARKRVQRARRELH